MQMRPHDQWEFFVQNLDEGIKKNLVLLAGPCFLCLVPVSFLISCTAKTQLSKSKNWPLRGPASQASFFVELERLVPI